MTRLRFARDARVLFAGLVLGALFIGEPCAAQVTAGANLPAALKDIRRASGTCPRRDLVPGADGATAQTTEQPDLDCASSVGAVNAVLARPDGVVIDLRRPADFNEFHIPGALNLTSAELHGKPYWKSKPLVLVGNGKAEVELYRECRRLKRAGYRQVRVLQGGMPMWLGQKQPVLGRAPSAPQLARLGAADLWAETQRSEDLVLLDQSQAALRVDLPGSQMLAETSEAGLRAAIALGKKERKGAPLSGVVLVAAPAVSDERIRLFQEAAMPLPLLVYADTREAYRQQVATQKAVWAAQARGPKLPGCGL